MSAAGITLKAHVLDAGCSKNHVVVEYDGHLFLGDLVTQGFHSWLELGLLEAWIKRIQEIKLLKGKVIHTGRGGSGYPDLLDRQEEYLKTVLKIVRTRKPTGELDEETAEEISDQIVARYPSYDYPYFVTNGLEAVWKNLSASSSGRKGKDSKQRSDNKQAR